MPGCGAVSAARRCFKHAREHAARMTAYRLSKKLASSACACGLTLARVDEAAPGTLPVACSYYKSGEHRFPVGRKHVPEGLL